MDHGWGSFRTTEGDVSVGDEALRIHRSPRKFLQGQRSRWRNGNRWEQLKTTVQIVLFLVVVPLSASMQLHGAIGGVHRDRCARLVGRRRQPRRFLARRVRGIAVPLSAIEDVTLDTDDRELTIVHDAEGRPSVLGGAAGKQWFLSDDPFSVFATGETETTLTLRTADDAREARTVFRTKGIAEDLDAPKGSTTETEYRFETKDGVVFCGQCGSQVSPSDRTCPACDHALRVERPKNADSREPATEF